MRRTRHTRRWTSKRPTLFRRRKPSCHVDLPASDDEDEDIIEIGGGPADDKPATA